MIDCPCTARYCVLLPFTAKSGEPDFRKREQGIQEGIHKTCKVLDLQQNKSHSRLSEINAITRSNKHNSLILRVFAWQARYNVGIRSEGFVSLLFIAAGLRFPVLELEPVSYCTIYFSLIGTELHPRIQKEMATGLAQRQGDAGA